MKVRIARVAGFCMGVRRAMDMALAASRDAAGPVFTYGPLIHNPSALALLEARGIHVLREIPERGEGTVIIRAHGVPPEEKARLAAAGFRILDATCGRVVKVQMIVRRHAEAGDTCLLVGDPGHPEVVGILGHAGGRGRLVSTEADIEALEDPGPYIVVAQTTQDRERFEAWSRRILARFPGGRVYNTICHSTHKRQAEVRRLAAECDAVVVVGGRQSANTRRLAEIAEETGRAAFAVETDRDLDRAALSRFRRVGVTAGASTPNWIINRVVREIEALPGRHESALRRLLYRAVRFLLESNAWTAACGAALAWAAARVLGRPGVLPAAPLAAAGFVFAVHTLYRLLDHEAGRYNDPLRARFVSQHKGFMAAASAAALAGALAAAAHLGRLALPFLLSLAGLAALYCAQLLPAVRRHRLARHVPGSKALLVALAWSSVAVLMPGDAWRPPWNGEVLAVFGLAAVLVYIRSVLLEILDVQGDQIVGLETLPVLVGEKRALLLVRLLAVALALAAAGPVLAGLAPRRLLAFVPAAAYLLALTIPFEKRRMGQNLRLEAATEGACLVLLAAALAPLSP
ncbi:4-hydroxy-3-methylbut-2-enyl diphosphate reductase [Dissulfurirhabdus thermomarina]|uniref:4-hydroxy-3-methylbut-2-enyl diphosphate reductase n=1 Tax=Dissulfurirhabdus thermomarina TaxID=1765737 RepID=UPI002852E9CE|nr:4-hydroxy-3-methylbut-2-enyl diphosphate reductase [Dissulfurirhabdus thermomarina]